MGIWDKDKIGISNRERGSSFRGSVIWKFDCTVKSLYDVLCNGPSFIMDLFAFPILDNVLHVVITKSRYNGHFYLVPEVHYKET